MEALMLTLLMLAAVLVSSVIEQLVPKVSSPLIQIALGLAIAVVAGGQIDIIFDEPDLFLVLFIAPLLYYEARSVDKTALWRNRKPVMSLAIGLVAVTALVIGVALHQMVPAISLAAAIALGAALSPTDAVAVASISKDADISERSKSILEGESLINDATGVVAFQFAIAAAVTGVFSPGEAALDFGIQFVGGLAVGFALGHFGNFLVRTVRSWGLENTTFHVLFEVFTPFIVFLAANQIGVSGILAVVAAGLSSAFARRTSGPAASRLNIVSGSTWRVLSFTLNGIVFVLLGTQLPRAMQGTWEDVHIPNDLLIAYVIALTLILIVARFTWVLAHERLHQRRAPGGRRRLGLEDLRATAIMTLGGAKGTITLAVVLTTPAALSQSELMMFLACGVIVITLLLATFAVPLLAPARPQPDERERRRETQVQLDILRTVVEELSARQTPDTRAATQLVIHGYNDRIARVKELGGIEDADDVRLRLDAIEWERAFVRGRIARGEVEDFTGYRYLDRLDHMEALIRHGSGRFAPRQLANRLVAYARITWHRIVHRVPGASLSESAQALRDVQIASCEHVIGRLRRELASNDSPTRAEDASALLLEYQRVVRMLHSKTPSITAITATADKAADIERMGLLLELEQIQARYEDGDLSRAAAKRLRENVNLMQMDLEDNI